MDTDSVKVVEDKVEIVAEEKVVTMYSKDQDEKTVVEMILEELIEACIKPARMIMKEPEESRHFDSSDSPKIIDISEDCSDEEEQTEGKEVTDEEVTTTNLVESVIDEILCSVIDQDSDVVSEIIEYIIEESWKVIMKKIEKKQIMNERKWMFASTDVRYRLNSTRSQDTSEKSGLSIFLVSQETRKIEEFLKVIKAVKKKCTSEKRSARSQSVRVDYLFKTNHERSMFEKEVSKVNRGEGLSVELLASTAADLGTMEKPVLTENEVMWIYSEGFCQNLFACRDFKVDVCTEKSGLVLFKFGERNLQLNSFLYCVLGREKALLGRVRREAKVNLPLRMKPLKKNGTVCFPVDIVGASEEDVRKQKNNFGFKIFSYNSKTMTAKIDFQDTVKFYTFWTSSFSHNLSKVKFSQVTIDSD